jgi:hypothetical protein
MADIGTFRPVKLICGLIAAGGDVFDRTEERLIATFGPVDGRSARFAFDLTDYYESEMGSGLFRGFLSFERLIDPSDVGDIKRASNGLEKAIRDEAGQRGRIVNIDPGYLTSAALIFATTKDFSHRVPLSKGIYAHLELLFQKNGIQRLSWTYPDFRDDRYASFFLGVRRVYLRQLKGE